LGEVKLVRDDLKKNKRKDTEQMKKITMRKYKVEYKQTETFIVDVYAINQKEAEKLASKKFDAGDYQETGDCEVELNSVYDVTNTDDPFYP
jgi:hypothetical protein